MKKTRQYSFIIIQFTILIFSTSLYAQSEHKNQFDRWFFHKNDTLIGVNFDELKTVIRKNNIKPVEEVIVAVIDAGFDFQHQDISKYIWKNKKETANNNIDDDKNGYIDDINGWNFLGNEAGENIIKTGTGYFREYKRLRKEYNDVDTNSLSCKKKKEYKYYKQMEKKAKIDTYIAFEKQLASTAKTFILCDSIVKKEYAYKSQPITVDDFQKIEATKFQDIKQSYNAVKKRLAIYPNKMKWEEVLNYNLEKYNIAHKRILSLDDYTSNPHQKIGNPINSFKDRDYGNNELNIDSYHGTMVSGLIVLGATQTKSNIRIMGIRAIPDGDEYDKDVATAIRYAVDNGAKIINMSFGKELSPYQKEVNKAIKYAKKHDVLLIKAAGNSGFNTDINPLYPTPFRKKDKKWKNMIVVGASTKKGKLSKFSCYGKKSVDILAPGTSIESTAPNNKYDVQNGTSLSAPIVSSIASVIRSYFPDLSAKEVKDILLTSFTDVSALHTTLSKRANRKTIKMRETCTTGGIIDAHKAFVNANARSRYNTKLRR